MRCLKIQNRKIHVCSMANCSCGPSRKNTMNKIKGNNVPWRKGKGWVGEVETVGLSGAADRKARKRRKNCVRLHRRGLHQQWIVCVRVCACVYIMFVIWQECSANQPVGKLALNMWQSGCWAMARLRERKREKRKTLAAWWARKRGKRKRQKWIKLNAMGIVLHDFCGFFRRGKKRNEEKENFIKRG